MMMYVVNGVGLVTINYNIRRDIFLELVKSKQKHKLTCCTEIGHVKLDERVTTGVQARVPVFSFPFISQHMF